MNELAYTKKAADEMMKDLNQASSWEDGCFEYAFTSSETERNIHNVVAGRLIEMGITPEVTVKVGRGRFNKGRQYARVRVYAN